MDTRDSFPQFKDLPLELRRRIWMFCLPRRIAEEDFPYTLLDGKDSRQACWPNRSVFQNARVPLLASVCAEAREVVFEFGKHQEFHWGTSLESRWVQPKIDRALHLNWTRRRNDPFYEVNDAYVPEMEDTPVEDFLTRALWLDKMPPSFVGELLYPFHLRELMDSLPPSDTESLPSAIAGRHGMPVPRVFEEAAEEDLNQIIVCVEDQTIYTTLVAISLHIDGAAALSSGLFGLSADAPVETVDYDDIPRLRGFYELFNSDPALKEAEPHVEKLLNVVLSPVFRAAVLSWQRKVRWLLQVVAWRRMQIGRYLKTFRDTDPRSVWTPPIPKEQYYIQMNHFMPNEDHPWWREHGERHIPKVVPQIMVRLCDNQCYKERGPEMFGEVWAADHPSR